MIKPSFLSTRRRNTKKHPVTSSLRAVTQRRKKQRVAAASHSDYDYDDDYDSGSRITRVLTIIFFIHVVAIGLIFVHHYYLKRGLPEKPAVGQAAAAAPASEQSAATGDAAGQPAQRMSNGDQVRFVRVGDNYATIAAAHEVDEADLRAANDNVEIRPGLILRIPPKRPVATETPLVAANHNPAVATPAAPVANPATDGLVPVNDPGASTAAPTQPEIPRARPVAGSGRVHVVQSGDTIWRISQQYKVSQEALMKINNISDPRRVRVGQKLQIP